MNKLHTPERTPELLAESARLAALPDETIDVSDIPLKLDWSNAERGKFHRPLKQQVTLRRDADVLHWFKIQSRPRRPNPHQRRLTEETSGNPVG